MIILPPAAHETFGFYDYYISMFAKTVNLFDALETAHRYTLSVLNTLDNDAMNYRYADGKWSIKEVVQHLIDSERVFCLRAMRFSRNELSPLPGFDVHSFVTASAADRRTKEDLLAEWELLRKATVLQYQSFDDTMLDISGPARDTQLSVRAIGFLIAGHEMHHIKVVKEKYLMQQGI